MLDGKVAMIYNVGFEHPLLIFQRMPQNGEIYQNVTLMVWIFHAIVTQ